MPDVVSSPVVPYQDWQRLRCQLWWCSERQIVEQATSRTHVTEAHVSAWLVRRGWAQASGLTKGGSKRNSDWTLTGQEGEWLVLPSGLRRQHFHPDCVMLSIAFEAEWPDGSAWIERGLPFSCSAREFPQLARQAKPMVTLCRRVMGADWHLPSHSLTARDFLQLQHCFHRWLMVLLDVFHACGIDTNDRGSEDQRVVRFMRQMEQQSLSKQPDWHKLAAGHNLSLVHLERLFRQAFSCSPVAHWQRLRLSHAQRCLALPGYQIKMIAADLGFSSSAVFSRWFKTKTGMNPRAWRERNQ